MTNQETIANLSDDAISRQAVIDACEQSINILEAVDRIMDLPSVNPQKNIVNNGTMNITL